VAEILLLKLGPTMHRCDRCDAPSKIERQRSTSRSLTANERITDRQTDRQTGQS